MNILYLQLMKKKRNQYLCQTQNIPIYITNGINATWYEVLTISVTVSNRDLTPGFNNPIFVKYGFLRMVLSYYSKKLKIQALRI